MACAPPTWPPPASKPPLARDTPASAAAAPRKHRGPHMLNESDSCPAQWLGGGNSAQRATRGRGDLLSRKPRVIDADKCPYRRWYRP